MSRKHDEKDHEYPKSSANQFVKTQLQIYIAQHVQHIRCN